MASKTGSEGQRGMVPTSNLEEITPALAAQWLLACKVNRRVSMSRVSAYARDMKSGCWRLTDGAISFDIEGNLINGAHRLEACVLANKPFLSFVVRGLPAEAQRYMDIGRGRSLADEFAVNGIQAAVRTAAAAQWLYAIKQGSNPSHKQAVTRAELWAILEKHRGLEKSGLVVHKSLSVRPALVAAMHYIGGTLLEQEEKASQFAQALTKTTTWYVGDPAGAFRDKVLEMRLTGKTMPPIDQLNDTVHAWNLFAAGKTVKRWDVPKDPSIQGLSLDSL